MLDGKAYKENFPDDPAYELPPGVPRQLNSAALMEALAALLPRILPRHCGARLGFVWPKRGPHAEEHRSATRVPVLAPPWRAAMRLEA